MKENKNREVKLPFKETKNIVANALKKYVNKSKKDNEVVLKQNSPEKIAEMLNASSIFENGFSNTKELNNFISTYLENTNHLKNPRYMGHQVAVPHDLSGIPDWIHGTINNPSSLYEMGPAGATLEAFMINWMLSQLGWFRGKSLYDFKKLQNNGSGILTHGGSIANMTALSAARSNIAPESWEKGNPKDLVVIGPSTSHYSIVRALSIMGMGRDSFVPVPVDQNEVIITSELENVYTKIKNEGKRIMAVVANACATSTGLFDPIHEMSSFCKKYNLWFHVDGAHGAVALLSPLHKFKVKGIADADSIIWDAHKMLRVPSLAQQFYLKSKNICGIVSIKRKLCLSENGYRYGFNAFTIECTKSALGTKLFWSIAIEGLNSIVDFIENSFKQAKDLYNYLNELEDFHCPYEPESNILCFQYNPDKVNDQKQLELRYQLINSGSFYITSCMMNKKRYLRAVMMNPLSKKEDYKALADSIIKIAAEI